MQTEKKLNEYKKHNMQRYLLLIRNQPNPFFVFLSINYRKVLNSPTTEENMSSYNMC